MQSQATPKHLAVSSLQAPQQVQPGQQQAQQAKQQRCTSGCPALPRPAHPSPTVAVCRYCPPHHHHHHHDECCAVHLPTWRVPACASNMSLRCPYHCSTPPRLATAQKYSRPAHIPRIMKTPALMQCGKPSWCPRQPLQLLIMPPAHLNSHHHNPQTRNSSHFP